MLPVEPKGGWPDDLTIRQIAWVWQAAGGNTLAEVPAVAVCLAESSGRRKAISPAGARGLWQIMPFNFSWTGLTWHTWMDPVDNARAAVKMSGNGDNWAAWDSAYSDIAKTGRYHILRHLQRGSAAYKHLAQVELVLGGHPHGVKYQSPSTNWGLNQNKASTIMHVVHTFQHKRYKRLMDLQHAWDHVARGG